MDRRTFLAAGSAIVVCGPGAAVPVSDTPARVMWVGLCCGDNGAGKDYLPGVIDYSRVQESAGRKVCAVVVGAASLTRVVVSESVTSIRVARSRILRILQVMGGPDESSRTAMVSQLGHLEMIGCAAAGETLDFVRELENRKLQELEDQVKRLTVEVARMPKS